MATFQQYNISPWLTPVRLCSSSNISGTYFNGVLNNGVGATLTISATSLTVDSVVASVGDRILLQAQSSANQNGIYVVLSIGSTVILQRAADQQSIEQLHTGFYVSVGAGSSLGGSAFIMVEPLPAVLGINNQSWVDASSSANITLPTIANHIATYTNTSGGLSEDPATAISGGNIQAGLSGTAGTLASFPSAATSGSLIVSAVTNSSGNFNTTISNASSVAQSQVISIPDGGVAASNFIISNSAGTQTIATGNLTLTAGNLSLTAGNVTAGSSGHAGTVTSFPGTAANGSLILAGVNAGGNFTTTISNGTMGQSTVYTMGDIGAATGGLVVATAAIRMKSVAQAAVAGGAAAQTVTDAFCTSGSMVTASWNDTTNAVQIQKVAAGNGSFVVTSTADPGASHLNYIITK